MVTINDSKIEALSEAQADKLLGKETFRKRVNEIILEHSDSVLFMKKVREYSGMEIDARLFTSVKFWLVSILSAALSALIGLGLGHFLK